MSEPDQGERVEFPPLRSACKLVLCRAARHSFAGAAAKNVRNMSGE